MQIKSDTSTKKCLWVAHRKQEKFLNSSVNNQLAHQNCSTDSRQIRQQNCPEKEERTVKKRKGVIRETGDGELAPGLRRNTIRDRQQ